MHRVIPCDWGQKDGHVLAMKWESHRRTIIDMAAKKKSTQARATITFIESMECLPVKSLPEGKEWSYEIKLDGFRLEAVKKNGKTTLYSRRRNVLNRKFPYIAE